MGEESFRLPELRFPPVATQHALRRSKSLATRRSAMNRHVGGLLYWSPRILGILFAAFISIFALDVFSEHLPFGRTMLALALHLIPTAIVLMVLLISWRWEWMGAISYFSLGVIYIVSMWKRFPLVTYVAISGPAFLIGVLFLFDWIRRGELRPQH